ncbi:MAG TPA: anhydro-N-acetylmuramic acid kinase [Spirochaetales bacterium]|nr:anhydro-N-acetylmuramic acid kinase [Spirochaetales bacterium]
MARLAGYAAQQSHILVGVMSGTSFDGIDAVAVRISTDENGDIAKVEYLNNASIPYSKEIKALLLPLCDVATSKIDDLVYAHFLLGEWYASVVQKLMKVAGLTDRDIDAVCIHGQTVWHAPTWRQLPGPGFESGIADNATVSVHGTLQIGCAAVVKERLGIPVLYDFRAADMAAQGEGAPLAPIVDSLLFGDRERGRIVQNIGGIGNATAIPAGPDEDSVFAFDTGPGNMIMDELVKRLTHGEQQYDADGAIAARGRVSTQLLDYLLDDPYFRLEPPKSTGREVYGAAFVDRLEQFASKQSLSYEDKIATATAFTAETIVRAYRDFIMPKMKIDDVVVSGGGALNKSLLNMMRQRLEPDVTVLTTMDFGFPPFVREPMAFALLGHLALMGRPGNLPRTTGAQRAVVLGSLAL